MPLCRGKSGKEALCCLRPHDDPYPADYPAAWGMPSHTVTARIRPDWHAYARSKGNPGSLPTDTSSPFAVSDPASSPPTPQHGSAVSHRDPRPRPAGHAYARSKRGSPARCPPTPAHHFAISNPASTPPAPPHGECLSRLRLFASSYASGRAAPALPLLPPNPPHSKKTGHTPGCVLSFYGIRRGYALAEQI